MSPAYPISELPLKISKLLFEDQSIKQMLLRCCETLSQVDAFDMV